MIATEPVMSEMALGDPKKAILMFIQERMDSIAAQALSAQNWEALCGLKGKSEGYKEFKRLLDESEAWVLDRQSNKDSPK